MSRSVVWSLTLGLVVGAFWVRAQRPAPAAAAPAAARPVPTFVELGSDRCVSCKAMIPVMETLRATYGARLEVRFVDVWADAEAGARYGVQAIPTQVLFGPDGVELTRHTGFWSAAAIEAAFAAHGHPLEAP